MSEGIGQQIGAALVLVIEQLIEISPPAIQEELASISHALELDLDKEHEK